MIPAISLINTPSLVVCSGSIYQRTQKPQPCCNLLEPKVMQQGRWRQHNYTSQISEWSDF